jgi:plastocyanin
MRTLLSAAAAAAVASTLYTAPAAQERETGTLAGHVRLATRVRRPLPTSAYPSRTIGAYAPAAAPETRNVVVYLKDPGARGELPRMRGEIRQRNETFTPHVVAITRGSTVDFPNDDPFFHNVFSLSSAATFDLGRYARGRIQSQTFTRAGLVKVYCHIHSHMSATILVLDQPYFAVPAVDGSFELPNVPAGQHTVVGWHERVGEQSVSAVVVPGHTTVVDLTLPLEDVQ